MRYALSLAALLTVSMSCRESGTEEAPPPLFENVAAAAGLTGVQGTRVAFADLDRDGYPEAILDRTLVFLNRPSGSRRILVRSDADAPLQDEGGRRADVVQVGDVNGDGIPDLFLGRKTDLAKEGFKDDGLRHEIWLGDGKGGFARVKEPGLPPDAENIVSACFVDADNDGILDLFLGNSYVEYGKSYRAFPDRLCRGKGDGTFEDVTGKAGLLGTDTVGRKDSRRPTFGVTHTDWNNDGWQDLMAMTYGRQANRLWRNNADGTFTDVAEETTFDGDADRSGQYPEVVKRKMQREDEPPFRSHGNHFDCAVADVDGDADMDCFLATIQHGWAGSSSDPSMLLVNRGKAGGWAFQREPDRIPRAPVALNTNHGDLHAGWIDVDNDGRLDLLIASSDYPDAQLLQLYRQEPDGTFADWTPRLGLRWVNAAQISLGDFDRDGATDILVGTSNMRLTKEQQEAHSLDVGLLRNLEAARAGNGFLNLRLVGGGLGRANRDAVGARVTIWTGGQGQTREVYGGLGCAGHRDDTDCRFGVGKARMVDRIEVRWPDRNGTVQAFTQVPASRFYVLEQGGALRCVAPTDSH